MPRRLWVKPFGKARVRTAAAAAAAAAATASALAAHNTRIRRYRARIHHYGTSCELRALITTTRKT
jgi:hypothetical protein